MSRENGLLAEAGWFDAEAEAIASDASDRSYLRLRRRDGARAILMRAPVARSDASRQQFDAFRRIGGWLRGLGLAAPAELAADADGGLLLLQDLGDLHLSHLLRNEAPEARTAYDEAAKVIACLADARPLPGLRRPSTGELAAMTGLTFDWLDGSDVLRDALQSRLAEELAGLMCRPSTVALRDMHGDNLIWRPGQRGLSRIGLLDFQDAVVLPDGYDLASLLDDPRLCVPEAWRRSTIAAHGAARGLSGEEMAFRVDLLSLQRNIRVLGIFRRLAVGMGRPAYALFLPRTRALLQRAADNPDLSRLRPHVAELVERTAQWQEEPA